jgi:hypothetical protein
MTAIETNELQAVVEELREALNQIEAFKTLLQRISKTHPEVLVEATKAYADLKASRAEPPPF